jgi:hypothetical protein
MKEEYKIVVQTSGIATQDSTENPRQIYMP